MELGAYLGIARKTRSTTGVGRAWGEGQLWGHDLPLSRRRQQGRAVASAAARSRLEIFGAL